MIFGEPVPFDDTYGIYMNDFLNLVNSANLTTNQIENDKACDEIEMENEKECEKEREQVIRFNSSHSVADYRATLNKLYVRAINELGIALSEIISKQDKLSLVTSLSVEVASFNGYLQKTKNNSFSHVLFQHSELLPKIKNYEELIDELSYKDYYYWMISYLQKTSAFLESQKEDIRSMSQDDLIKYPSIIKDKNVSTKEKPLIYFEYLFTRNGLSHLLNNFLSPDLQGDYERINYDSKTETIKQSYIDSETGDLVITDRIFEDYYLNRLIKEFKKSITHIDEYIDDQEQDSFVIFYIKKTHNKLVSLLKTIEGNDAIKKYDHSSKAMKGLIEHLKIKNLCYSNNILQVVDDAKTDDEKQTKKVACQSFGYKEEKTEKLKNVLISLTRKVGLLANPTTDCDELLDLLCSEDFSSKEYKINVKCETTQFSYIIKELRPYFKKLKPTTIEASKCFYSKTGTLIIAQNIYSSTIDNVKEKETIDNIIKRLQ
jgi:hypothetical protein